MLGFESSFSSLSFNRSLNGRLVVPCSVIKYIVPPRQFLFHADVCWFDRLAFWNMTGLIQSSAPWTLIQQGLISFRFFQTFLGTTNRCPVGSVHPASFFLECLKLGTQFLFIGHRFFICRIFQRRVMYFSLIHQYARRRINCWEGRRRWDLRDCASISNRYSTRLMSLSMWG